MAFGRSYGYYRVYEYGALPSRQGQGLAAAEAAMQERVRLWNRLVELDRVFMAEQNTRLDALIPGRLSLPADERRQQYQRPEVKAVFADITARRRAAAKATKAESDLWWPNADDVLQTYELAAQKAYKTGASLNFHSARQHGKLFVRWQHGLPVADAFGDDTRLRIEPVDPRAWQTCPRCQTKPKPCSCPTRGERRRLQRTRMWVRVGSANRLPVWLELTVIMHRPLPPDGIIRSVAVLRDREGPFWHWKVTVTVAVPEPAPAAATGPAVAIDLGWRRVPGGLRVAAVYDSNGLSTTLCLPESWLKDMEFVRDLQALRAKHRNALQEGLLAWLANAPSIPQWLRDMRPAMRHWKSPDHFSRLYQQWQAARFDGDDAGFALLAAWKTRDHHLHAWEGPMRARLLRQRRELYRLFAAELSRKYAEVVLEDFKVQTVASVRKDQLHAAARYQRFLAAPSVLKHVLQVAMQRQGGKLVVVPAAYSTQTCPACGVVYAFNAARELVHTCAYCGTERDQDVGAAQVLLARASQP